MYVEKMYCGTYMGIEKYFWKTTSSENVKIGGAKIMVEKICDFYSV